MIGLYTAYLLLEQGFSSKDIRIVAKHVPGDLSHDYASPYAGATVNFVKSTDPDIKSYYKYTYQKLGEIRKKFGASSCGVDLTTNTESWIEMPKKEQLEFFKSYNNNWRELKAEEMPKGAKFGLSYQTFVINSPLFIRKLFDFVTSEGIKIDKREVKHILEIFDSNTEIVFNCSGLGASKLGGVEDSKCHPTRAQVTVIRAPHLEGVRLHWNESANYMIKRPFSGDEVILGGFYQPKNYNRDVNGYETKDILKRVTECFPILKEGQSIKDLDILREVSAFRPGREGGVRIEKESISGKTVVHNYGAEGTGFVQGLGMARHAIQLAIRSSKL